MSLLITGEGCEDGETATEGLKHIPDYNSSLYFSDHTVLKRTLQGSVVQARCIKTGREVAIKSSDLSLIKQKSSLNGQKVLENVLLEVSILQRTSELTHNNIVEMFDAFTDASNVYIVLELCHGGELYDKIEKYGALEECNAKLLMKQILDGLSHLHNVLNVCHLDLSLENVFLDAEENAKIGDFGLARECKESDDLFYASLSTRPGKVSYMSPEILACGAYHGKKADVFSAGVIMFTVLFGFPPFDAACPVEDVRYSLIAENRLLALLKKWRLANSVSSAAIDLMQQMLRPEATRISTEDALNHLWFQDVVGRDELKE